MRQLSAARAAPAARWGMWLACVAVVAVGATAVAVRTDRESAVALAMLALATSGAIAAILWHAAPAMTFIVAVLLSPIAGWWNLLHVPGTFSPQRLLLVVGVGAVLLRAPAVAHRRPLPTSAIHYALALASVYVVVSAAVAGTLTDKSTFFKLFETFGILLFVVFYVAPAAFASRRHRDALLMALLLLGGYLGVTAILETTGPRSLVLPSYIENPAVGIHWGRARGPFLEAVTNGTALYLGAAAAVAAMALWRSTRARMCAGVVLLVCCLGMMFSLQRSVWLAALIATLTAGLAIGALRRYVGVLLLVVAIVAGIVYTLAPSDEVSARLNQQDTVWQREDLNTAALNMITARPLIGFGWGTFPEASLAGDFYEQAPDHPLQGFAFQVHNEFLSHGAELGLVGFTLWFGCLVAAAAWVLKSPTPDDDLRIWKAVFLAYAVFYLVVSNFVPPQFFPNLMFWLLAGVAAAGRARRPDSKADAPSRWFADSPRLRVLKVVNDR